MKKTLTKILSSVISIMLSTNLPFSASSAKVSDFEISIGKNTTCAAGQLIDLQIEISAMNDFESAEFMFYYENTDLDIQKVYTTAPNLNLAWNNFEEDNMLKICIYTNDGAPADDGAIGGILFKTPQVDKGSLELTLDSLLFATYNNGEIDLEDASVTYSIKEKLGDANGDNILNVRDAAFISKILSSGNISELPGWADFNSDGKINVRDAAAIARAMASGSIKK